MGPVSLLWGVYRWELPCQDELLRAVGQENLTGGLDLFPASRVSPVKTQLKCKMECFSGDERIKIYALMDQHKAHVQSCLCW